MSEETGVILTVRGPVESQSLGRTLVHEHILVDFIGAGRISRDRYDREAAFTRLRPLLEEVHRQGIQTLVECTPNFLGRDPLLLSRLSELTGLSLVTNTGLYAAGSREKEETPFLPDYAYTLNTDELAGTWLKEWYEGIEGSGVRPGFMKIGVNRGSLSEISRKIVRAAARVSRRTGMAIAAHTGAGLAALQSMDIIEEEGVPAGRHIFVHAQGEPDFALHREYLRRGGWIEYDGISPDSAARHLELVLKALEEGYEDQILISQDAGWYRPGEPGGGEIRGYTYLLDHFIPALRSAGVPEDTIDHLLIYNPARALAVS